MQSSALSVRYSLIPHIENAIKYATGGGGGSDALLATLTFENTHASVATPSESYVTFGMAFKKGDVPSGNVPELRVSSSPIPAQFDLRNTWPDNSLRWCEVSCITSSIAGGGTQSVAVYSVIGSFDNTASRTVDDIDATGGHDFKVAITSATLFGGGAYDSGTMTAAFNSSTPEIVKSGPVCVQWRGWTSFETQTVDHLGAWFYITAWTKDSDSTLGPISHISKVYNGYIELAGPTRYVYDAAYKDGASTIRSRSSLSHPNRSSWWTCGDDGLSDWTASEATVIVKPDTTYLKSTGLMPPYDLTVTPTNASLTVPGVYTPFDACSATEGSVTYQCTLALGTAGGAPMRGWLPQWAAEAFLTQDTGFIQHTRVQALVGASITNKFVNELTGRIPAYRGSSALGDTGDYTGLGTNHRDTWYFSNSNKSANIPSISGGDGIWTSPEDWAHMPLLYHYTILTEGGAHLLDDELVHVNFTLGWLNAGQGTGYAAFSRSQRIDSGSSYHYGVFNHGAGINGIQTRQIAWSMLALAYLYSKLPDDWDEKPYVEDCMTINAVYANAIIADYGANFQEVGSWSFEVSVEWAISYMHSFLCGALAQAYKITEDSDILGWANHCKKLRIISADGTIPCAIGSCAEFIQVHDQEASPGVYAAAANCGFSLDSGLAAAVLFTANAGTDVCTLAASAQWDPHNDDKLRLSDHQGNSYAAQTIPGGLSVDTWYWLVNVSGRTFKLSLTQGGSAVDITSAGSGNIDASWRPATCPTTFAVTASDNYLSIAQSSLAYMVACGITGCGTAHDNIEAKTGSVVHADNPVWALTDSF